MQIFNNKEQTQHIRRGSLFRKHFIMFSISILASLIILGSIMMLFVSNFWTEECLNSLMSDSKSVAELTRDIFATGRMDDQNSLAAQNSIILICSSLANLSSTSNSDVFICDISGSIILCKDMLSSDMNIVQDNNCETHSSITIPSDIIYMSIFEGYMGISDLNGSYPDDYFIATHPIIVQDTLKGFVVSSQPVSVGFRPYIVSFFKMFLFSALFALFLSFITVYIITYNLTKPLSLMSTAIKRYAKGDFRYRIPVKGDDEIAQLTASFNSMAGALSALETSRRSFVANVSHELKTPMTTIAGFIDGILDGTIEEDKRNYYLTIVSDEVKRLSRLIASMLNLSKIETGELQLKISRFNISDQIFKTMLTFEKLISDKQITIDGLDLIEDTPVSADEDMIYQVIYNLIDNAVKFTNQNGVIGVSVNKVNSFVEVCIRNTGNAIPEEEINRIFDRFYKVDKSRSLDSKSAGLGLYIVKSIIEMHGGNIKVTSQEGSFTQFSFILPNQL